MSLLSERTITDILAQTYDVKKVVGVTNNIESVVSTTFTTQTTEVGPLSMSQQQDNLIFPNVTFDGNLVVTGVMMAQTGTATVAMVLGDSAGPDHFLLFEDGLLTNYSNFQFYFTVNTANLSMGSSLATQFKLPLVSTGTYNFTVVWGDNTFSTIDSWNSVNTLHTYPAPGIYTVNIFGTCEGWVFADGGDKLKMLNVLGWGPGFKLGTTEGSYFYGCSNLQIVDIVSPNLVGTTNLSRTFQNCTSLDVPTLSNWNVSEVTDMSYMFSGCTLFNHSLNTWNVEKVQNMSYMFANAVSFKQSLGGWIPKACTDMTNMFQNVDMNNPSSAMSQTNYNTLLNSWGAMHLAEVQPNVTFSAGSSKYVAAISGAARTALINKGWTISDGGTTVLGQFKALIDTTKAGSANNGFQLPLVSSGSYNFTVNWGDGQTDTIVAYTDPKALHEYAAPGQYTITIDGQCIGWVFNNTGDKLKLLDITKVNDAFQLGTDQGSYFYGCANLQISASGAFYLVGTTNMENAFRGCTSLVSSASLGLWDMSDVQNMKNMFSGCTVFNQDLSDWVVSKVTDMTSMFENCIAFNNGEVTNQGLVPLTWTTTDLQLTPAMFKGAFAFNQNVSSFSMGNVTNMSEMFANCDSFDNGTGYWGIKDWNTENVKDMSYTFYNCPVFNEPLDWNTSQVTNMSYMFGNALAFNQNIGGWVVTKVQTMENMFNYAITFNNGDVLDFAASPLNWTTSALTTTHNMFLNCVDFNQSVGSFDMSNVTTTESMFEACVKFNNGNVDTIKNWKTGAVTTMKRMFFNCLVFNQPLTYDVSGKWNTAAVNTMLETFSGCTDFNQDLSGWNVSAVQSTESMFYKCTHFNNGNPLNTAGFPLTWTTTALTNMSHMFEDCSAFNQSVGSFTVNNVTKMSSCFLNCTLFNNGGVDTIKNWVPSSCQLMDFLFGNCSSFAQPLVSNWGSNTGACTNMSSMFGAAVLFNADLSSWDVSNVTDMSYMFFNCSVFNNGGSPDIANWKTGNVKYMNNMFQGCSVFNQALPYNTVGEKWNTAKVENMSSMFSSCTIFNQDLSSWLVTSVQNMSSMFANADAFNNGDAFGVSTKPLTWTTTALLNTSNMFLNATSFNQSLGSFNMSKVTTTEKMFDTAILFNNGGSATIGDWETSAVTNMSRMFYNCVSFNQPLNTQPMTMTTPLRWDVSEVTNMNSMFYGCGIFNKVLTDWNVSKVTDMTSMFQTAYVFNNGQVTTYGTITPSTSTYSNAGAVLTCPGANFTAGVSGLTFVITCNTSTPISPLWNTFSSVVTYQTASTVTLNTPLSGVSSLVAGRIVNIESSTATPNAPLTWATTALTAMAGMFYNARLFNQTVNFSLGPARVTSLQDVFNTALSFQNGDLFTSSTKPLNWYVTDVTNFKAVFSNAIRFNQTLGLGAGFDNWNISKATDCSYMFYSARKFNNGFSDTPMKDWTAPLCTTFDYMFSNAVVFNQPLSNLVDTSVLGTLIPPKTCTLIYMFRVASAFNQNIGNWNLTRASSLESMFSVASAFNNGGSNTIQSWTAPLCTNFNSMFFNAVAFNQPLPDLVKSNNLPDTMPPTFCTLVAVFGGATLFNGDLSGWNLSKVSAMNQLFSVCTSFNNTSISDWTAPLCTTFANMFDNCVFNQPINNLVNTSGVSSCDLSAMFQGTSQFNQEIHTWDLTNVTSMARMFYGNTVFNNDSLQNWSPKKCLSFSAMFQNSTFNRLIDKLVDTSELTEDYCTLLSMFESNIVFNQDIHLWKLARVQNMSRMFAGRSVANTTFNNGGVSLSGWTAPLCTTFQNMFLYNSTFNVALTNLVKTTGVASCILSNMFQNASAFNQDIGYNSMTGDGWVLTNVTDCNTMFASAIAFNNGGSDSIKNWSAHKCTTFQSMFSGATAFNQPLDNLVNTSTVGCTLQSMFNSATLFNQNLSTWNVSNVTNMSSMFATSGFKNLGMILDSWKAPKCTTFASMFFTNQFNSSIANLVDTSDASEGVATVLTSMFSTNFVFNQNVGTWKVEKVTNMSGLFNGAQAFNNGGSDSIKDWSAPNCTNFSSMFNGAYVFNQPLNNLVNTSDLTGTCDCNGMFGATRAFNQNLNTWNTSKVSNMSSMFSGSTTAAQTTVFNNGQAAGTVPGTAPLLWDTRSVTNLLNMFRYCNAFNQSLTTTGNIWNVSSVTQVSQLFQGTATTSTNFNNGQAAGDNANPMQWLFNGVPTSTNYRQFSQLTAGNKPASLA